MCIRSCYTSPPTPSVKAQTEQSPLQAVASPPPNASRGASAAASRRFAATTSQPQALAAKLRRRRSRAPTGCACIGRCRRHHTAMSQREREGNEQNNPEPISLGRGSTAAQQPQPLSKPLGSMETGRFTGSLKHQPVTAQSKPNRPNNFKRACVEKHNRLVKPSRHVGPAPGEIKLRRDPIVGRSRVTR